MLDSIGRKDEREERFGRAKYGLAWVELSEAELDHIKNIRDIAADKSGQSERVSCRPLNGSWTNYDLPLMVFYGLPCDHEAAKLAWARALTRRDQVTRVRKILRLLDWYGPGAPPQRGTLHQYDYDPLEQLYVVDNREELEEARELYWRIRHGRASPESPPGDAGTATESQPSAATMAPERDEYSVWLANLKNQLVRIRRQREGLPPGGEVALTWREATKLIEEGWLRRDFAVSNVPPGSLAIWAILNEIATSAKDHPTAPSPRSLAGDAGLRSDIDNAVVTHKMGPPLGPPMEPADATDIPLFEAVYWIATEGGGVGFDPSHQHIWRDAWSKLTTAWRCGRVTVTGRPANGGFPEKISGDLIAGIRIMHPFNVDPVGDPIFGTGPYIQCFGRTDDEHWERKGLNDQLYMPGKNLGWTHLLAKADELKALWPFEPTQPKRADPMATSASDGTASTEERRPWIVIEPLTAGEESVFEVMQVVFPNGIQGCSAKDRDSRIREAMTARGYTIRGGKTITRTLQKVRFPS